MDVKVKLLGGGTIEPVFFKYPMGELRGEFRFHNNRLEIERFEARHNSTRLAIDHGDVDLLAGGGYHVDLSLPKSARSDDSLPRRGDEERAGTLKIGALVADEAFLQALPRPLKSFVGTPAA